MSDKNQIFKMGQQAYTNCLSLIDNPFDPLEEIRDYSYWQAGWIDEMHTYVASTFVLYGETLLKLSE